MSEVVAEELNQGLKAVMQMQQLVKVLRLQLQITLR